MFSSKPTVIEVNKFVEPVVTRLLSEYKKVTHPDFEKNLREETGIGWKQVKNYRNHPEPYSVLPGNSKVLRYVYAHRKQNKFYRWKQDSINLISVVLVLSIVAMIFLNLRKTRFEYEKSLNTLIEKRVTEGLGALGLLKCRKLGDSSIECPDGMYFKVAY